MATKESPAPLTHDPRLLRKETTPIAVATAHAPAYLGARRRTFASNDRRTHSAVTSGALSRRVRFGALNDCGEHADVVRY
jgi:hypothetical protein